MEIVELHEITVNSPFKRCIYFARLLDKINLKDFPIKIYQRINIFKCLRCSFLFTDNIKDFSKIKSIFLFTNFSNFTLNCKLEKLNKIYF